MVRVLYIAGEGRSGSTLLDRLLGEVEGVSSGGELREIWYWGVARDASCGCGEAFSRCPFWKEVGLHAYGGWSAVPLQDLLGWTKRAGGRGMINQLKPGGRPQWQRRYGGFRSRLYEAIASVSGARIVVDSSKLPSEAMLLRNDPSVDLRVVHLVRDSRGVAYSWGTHVRRDDLGPDSKIFMHRFSPARIALRWMERNLSAEALGPFGLPTLRIRYEDLVTDPAGWVSATLGSAGSPSDPKVLDFIGQGTARLGAHHTIMGNPSRVRSGVVPITLDDRWRRSMRPGDRRLVTGLTAPLLGRYGYLPHRSRRPSQAP